MKEKISILFRQLILLVALPLFCICPAHAGEFRSFWVDAWKPGFESPSATQGMVNYIKGCNGNAILLEVRKRADAYYSSAIEPTGVNITPQAGYDPLADVISKAHAAGMEVHAWVVTYRVWDGKGGPSHSVPEHIWYLHPEWFTQDNTGNRFYEGLMTGLDPGCPGVEDYLVKVFMDIVKRYDVDGITLDYIRYPGTSWGYNPITVARFDSEYGRSGSPSASDILWQSWRRDQISNLVKRLYLEVKSVKPKVKVGAATWRTAESGASDVLQDWERWLSDHYIDYVSPMNYTTNNSVFHSNNQDSVGRGHGRHIYIAPGSYLNTTANNITQVGDVRSTGLPGTAFFSYAEPNSGAADLPGARGALLSGPWSSSVPTPDMPWLSSPTSGWIKGLVTDTSEKPIYPVTVTVLSQNLSTKDSGTGFYGFCDIAPGTYTVTATAPGYATRTSTVTVTAGKVADLNLVLTVDDAVPPGRSDARR
jgi:uncharacterized lipoprotein YddW (UPF0748 family)